MIDTPGIYTIDEQVYHGPNICIKPCLSKGIMWDMLTKSPLHAWTNHPALNPDFAEVERDESKFDIGRAAHTLLLEGYDKIAIIEHDDYRKAEARQARDNARLDGKIPLKVKEWDQVSAMVGVAKQFLRDSELGIQDIRAEGDSELSIVWEEDDIWCKCRPDWLAKVGGYILDYKTTGIGANPAGLDRHILNMGYHVQDAFYKRGFCALTGETPRFIFLFQEVKPPYCCSLNDLTPAFADYGNKRVEEGMKLWRRCIESKQWPAYPLDVCSQVLPGWALAQMEMMDIMESEGLE